MEPGRHPILSPLGRRTNMLSPFLVETISINIEEFSDGFLTCSTCLCTYDSEERIPKLLTCSHTVCLHCLSQIVRAAQSPRDLHRGRSAAESFCCPICREVIQVPRGGVESLPVSFMVNQLLDLVSRQRRDVIPKCGVHPSQDLLFCESCDVVFCSVCTAGVHGQSNHDVRNASGLGGNSTCLSTDHTVVPFSIAIKRMSEILLYKANEIVAKLLQAEDNVSSELRRLEQSKIEALTSVEEAFSGIEDCLRKAKQEALASVTELAEQKSQVLYEQLDAIKSESAVVKQEVSGLQYQVEVRSLSDRIAALQCKLDSVAALVEPRENSYLVYEPNRAANDSGDAMKELEKILRHIGQPRSSTAFSSLCTLSINEDKGCQLLKSPPSVAARLSLCGTIATVDYYGRPKRDGGDPIKVTLVSSDLPVENLRVIDAGDGTYRFWFRLPSAQHYTLRASLFGRPLKNSPVELEAVDYHQPMAIMGSKGSSENEFQQPTGIAIERGSQYANDNRTAYVLDSGNQRIVKYRTNPMNGILNLDGYLKSPAVDGRSATGLCIAEEGYSLWVANWKIRSVCEVAVSDGRILRKITFPALKEPIDVSTDSQRNVLIADAGQSSVFVVEPPSGDADPTVLLKCGSPGSRQGQFGENALRSVTSAFDDDIVAADCSRIQVFSNKGKFLKELGPKLVKGFFEGLAFDSHGLLLASFNEGSKVKSSRSGILVISYRTGDVIHKFESTLAELKRPGRLCCLSFYQDTENCESKEPEPFEDSKSGFVFVADVGYDCIKQYRYL